MAASTTGVSIQRLGHVGILVSDLPNSKKFYEDIVGLEEHNRVPQGASDSEARMTFFGTKGALGPLECITRSSSGELPIVLMYRKRFLNLRK